MNSYNEVNHDKDNYIMDWLNKMEDNSSQNETIVSPFVRPDNNQFKKVKKDCKVCADGANGKYYGAVVCEGCKIFFRRSVLKDVYRTYSCKNGMKDCNVNEDRNHCKYCRFTRCLSAGMRMAKVSSMPRKESKNWKHIQTRFIPTEHNCYHQNNDDVESIAKNPVMPMKSVNTMTDEELRERTEMQMLVEKTRLVYRQTLADIFEPEFQHTFTLDLNDKISQLYNDHKNVVNAYVESLDLLSKLPQNEKISNLQNANMVLMLRTAYWYSMNKFQLNLNLGLKTHIRILKNLSVERNGNKSLEAIISLGETLFDMRMTEIEFCLTITYILLLGLVSFFPDVNNPIEPTETAKAQKQVLRALSLYQKDMFPTDDHRFVSLLVNISELACIAGTS